MADTARSAFKDSLENKYCERPSVGSLLCSRGNWGLQMLSDSLKATKLRHECSSKFVAALIHTTLDVHLHVQEPRKAILLKL